MRISRAFITSRYNNCNSSLSKLFSNGSTSAHQDFRSLCEYEALDTVKQILGATKNSGMQMKMLVIIASESILFFREIITFAIEWWNCRQRQPSQQGSTQGATCILHSLFFSPCRSIHRIRQSTGGNPARKQKTVNFYSDNGSVFVFFYHSTCKCVEW